MGADLRALVAEDALRPVFPPAGLFVDLYVHRAGAQTLSAADAFALVAVDAQKRKIAHRFEEHRDGTQVFAERAVISEHKGKHDTRDVIEHVPREEQPEHDLLQMCSFHQKEAGYKRQ